MKVQLSLTLGLSHVGTFCVTLHYTKLSIWVLNCAFYSYIKRICSWNCSCIWCLKQFISFLSWKKSLLLECFWHLKYDVCVTAKSVPRTRLSYLGTPITLLNKSSRPTYRANSSTSYVINCYHKKNYNTINYYKIESFK